MANGIERPIQLFGNRNRTAILIAIPLLQETYASELAAMLQLRIYTVQSAIASFEREGVVAGRLLGRTRRIALDPRYVAAKELSALLWKLGQQDLPLQAALGSRRRRPRRSGKPGL